VIQQVVFGFVVVVKLLTKGAKKAKPTHSQKNALSSVALTAGV
jgi:hypothetical protein